MALVVTLIVCAKLAGMTTPEAIAQWVRLRADWLKQVLPCSRPTFPCASTYRNVLWVLDAEQVTQVLAQFLIRQAANKHCGEEPSRLLGQAEREQHVHVALDDKTVCGTLSHMATDQKKMHQLGLYEVRTGVLLKEQVVGDKHNELNVVSEFLAPLWVKRRIVSADASHTQHAFCTRVTAAGGDYLLLVIMRDYFVC